MLPNFVFGGGGYQRYKSLKVKLPICPVSHTITVWSPLLNSRTQGGGCGNLQVPFEFSLKLFCPHTDTQ